MAICVRTLVALLCLTAQAVGAQTIPVSAFSHPPQVDAARISPDGKHLLTVSQLKGNSVALIMDAETLTVVRPALSVRTEDKKGLAWCQWGNDTRILCSISSIAEGGRYPFDVRQLVAVNIDGSNMKELLRPSNAAFVQFADTILDWTPNDPQAVLVQAPDNIKSNADSSIGNASPAVFKLDIYSGDLQLHTRSNATITAFRSDYNGQIRLGISRTRDDKRTYLGRLLGDNDWRRLSRVDAYLLTDGLIPMHVMPNTNRALAWALHNGRRSIWEIDLEDKLDPMLVAEHPSVDLGGAMLDQTTGQLVAYSYETTRPFGRYTDTRLANVMRSVDASLQGRFNWPVSYLDDFRRVVVLSTSDTDAGTFYLFDAKSRKLQPFAKRYPGLDINRLSRTRAVQYPAKDGTLIPALLTVPLGASQEKLPLVVLPHGDAASRSSWRFDYLRQFIANRGYAVLEVNFRGSFGYGDAWLKAGLQDWTGVIYSDVVDATRGAIGENIADETRVCIAGRANAGMLSLLGTIHDSSLFKCAISIAGVADHVDYLKTFFVFDAIEKQTGRDLDKTKDKAPLQQARAIGSPILLVHGRLDTIVPIEQSEKMARALTGANKPHEFVRLDLADHQFSRERDRTELLTKVESFLAKYIGTKIDASTPQH